MFDLLPGVSGARPTQLTVTNDALFFAAEDGEHGFELWNFDPKIQRLPGDVDGNGMVDFLDFLILSDNFGSRAASPQQGDINGDSIIDFDDFVMLSANFGKTVVTALNKK